MRSPAAARRYSRALFSIARDETRIEDVRRELAAIQEVMNESTALRNAILQPLHPGAERRGVFKGLCQKLGISGVVTNFCSFLVDQRRVIDFEAICEAFGLLADEAAGRTRARVVSASPLSDTQRLRLRNALAARTGLQVELEESVDSSLLGGAVASVGDMVFDGSLRTQLEQLRSSLTRGQ
jgi:F-type H+-transporting ATPase subunit delta